MLSNLRSMAIFATLVEQGSFSAAAKELGISTSAVSQQISNLEKVFNVKLITRQTRKIQLTEAGKSFFIYCQQIVQAAQQGQGQLVSYTNTLKGNIRIATTPEIATLHLIPVIKRWAKTHPQLSISINSDSNVLNNSNTPDYDLSIQVTLNPPPESDTVIHLKRCHPIFCAGPKYLEMSVKINRPEDINNHPILFLENLKDSSLNFHNIKTDETTLIQPNVRYSSDNIQTLKSMAELDYGLLYILDQDIIDKIHAGTLQEVLKDWKLPHYTISLHVVPTASPELVEPIISLLKHHFDSQTI